MKILKTKIFTSITLGLTVLISLSPTLVRAAQNSQQRCDNFKAQFGGMFNWVTSDYCTAGGLAQLVIKTLLTFSGVVAVLFIIVGGFWYLTSAGNEEQSEKGRKTLVNAILGLVIIILSSAIVTIVANTLGN